MRVPLAHFLENRALPPTSLRSMPALLFLLPLAAGEPPTFKGLGEPVKVRTLRFSETTRDAAGRVTAWAALREPCLGRTALVGVRIDSGEVIQHDLSQYGRGKITFVKAADANLYLYVGSPAHFLRYDAAKNRIDNLGAPVRRASYFGPGALGRDGKYYVGSYPTASLACCDTRTGQVHSLGRMPTDPRQRYIFPSTVESDDLVVYCPVGLHHMELWAYDTRSGTKKQILPEPLTQRQGAPRVWKAKDGHVYGRVGNVTFLCRPDGVERGRSAPAAGRPPLRAGDVIVGGIDSEGRLQLTDSRTKQVSLVQTQYEGRRVAIFSVACERDGVVYGSSVLPGHTFTYDTRTGKMSDLGVITRGTFEVYDIINTPRGLFMGSYFGAHVDFYNPAKPIVKGTNPRYLGRAQSQERPMQWCLGPDSKLYIGTIPAKGRLGGALMRVDPKNLSLKVWPSPIANQSILYLAAIPETGQLFCTTSVRGGTSAIPTEKEACVFLWDTAKDAMVFQARPVPGARAYGAAVRGRNGLIYGLAGAKYYAFDPRARKVVFTGDLPVKRVHFPQLHDRPVGARGLIVGLGDDAIFAIDPADHSVCVLARHKSIAKALGFCVANDGILYYGSAAMLMRCKLALAGQD